MVTTMRVRVLKRRRSVLCEVKRCVCGERLLAPPCNRLFTVAQRLLVAVRGHAQADPPPLSLRSAAHRLRAPPATDPLSPPPIGRREPPLAEPRREPPHPSPCGWSVPRASHPRSAPPLRVGVAPSSAVLARHFRGPCAAIRLSNPSSQLE
ncbi:hypothetical protein Syun_021717 [Stephania yunnanensis]|uniref:Uncharacterized protein n=1 Tax=Stephania yunnanensis TaxID=152371 RepID=A0AAP0IGK5_9MAGN